MRRMSYSFVQKTFLRCVDFNTIKMALENKHDVVALPLDEAQVLELVRNARDYAMNHGIVSGCKTEIIAKM